MPSKVKQSIECWLFAEGLNASVLLLQAGPTQKHPAYWQPVTGGIESGETSEQACRREVWEETGIVLEAAALRPADSTFDITIDEHTTLHKTLFLAVVPHQRVQISEEHIGWQWVPFSEAKELLYWPSSFQTYAAVSELLRR